MSAEEGEDSGAGPPAVLIVTVQPSRRRSRAETQREAIEEIDRSGSAAIFSKKADDGRKKERKEELTLLNAFSADVLGRIRAVPFGDLIDLVDDDNPDRA
jgi:hypothetical protein